MVQGWDTCFFLLFHPLQVGDVTVFIVACISALVSPFHKVPKVDLHGKLGRIPHHQRHSIGVHSGKFVHIPDRHVALDVFVLRLHVRLEKRFKFSVPGLVFGRLLPIQKTLVHHRPRVTVEKFRRQIGPTHGARSVDQVPPHQTAVVEHMRTRHHEGEKSVLHDAVADDADASHVERRVLRSVLL